MQEIWKSINGYEGKYEISNLGRVRSNSKHKKINEDKCLSPAPNKRGYLTVSLFKNGKHLTKKIHRLVAQAFLPNPENKPQVNHIDGDKTNNCVDNLEWATQEENIQHSYKLGLHKRFFGKDNHLSKTVIQYDLKMNEIERFGSLYEIKRKKGFFPSIISKCCNNKKYCKTAYGYIWKYAE